MKNALITMALALTAVIAIQCKSDSKTAVQAEETELTEIHLADFEKKAGAFVDKEIIVTGIVDHVCKHGGKKILLVSDEGEVHITSDERFDENLMGSMIAVKGVVLEERIDEAYCLKMEEDNIKSHSEGKSTKEQYEARMEHVKQYREQMKALNSDHISKYSMAYVSHNEIEKK